MLLTAKQWSARGYRIRTGATSYYRGAGNAALFDRCQVTQWDYTPRPREFVVVDGYTYRRV